MGLRFSYLNPFIPHRMTTAERDAEEWPNYAVIENTTLGRIQQFVDEIWIDIAQVYGDPSDEDFLIWNDTEGYYEPKSAAEVLATLSGEAAANFAMNSQKFTGLAAGSGAGDSVRYEQLHAVESGESGTHNHGNLYYTEGEVDGLLHDEDHKTRHAGGADALYSAHQYVFAPDAAPGDDVETGTVQGLVHVSGPSTETVKRITVICETAAGTTFTFTLDYDSGNDDFDSFTVDTEIDEVAVGTSKGVVVSSGFTTGTITARSLIALDITVITGAPKDVTIILEVWRELQA